VFVLFKTKPPKVRLDALDHPILGRLEPHEELPEVLRSVINVGGAEVEVWVAPDGGPLDAALRLATDAASGLSELDARCRMLIANDSLASYNSGWRFGAVVQADGSTKNFEKPCLNAEQFASTLTPTTLEVTGDNTIALWYSDGDMFWGHSLCLTSFDGLALTDVTVEMLG
jgi:hypothetical protein